MEIQIVEHAAFGKGESSKVETYDGSSYCVRFKLTDGRIVQLEHAGESVIVRTQYSGGNWGLETVGGELLAYDDWDELELRR